MELHQLKFKSYHSTDSQVKTILHVEIHEGVRIHSNGLLLCIKVLKETYLAVNLSVIYEVFLSDSERSQTEGRGLLNSSQAIQQI